MEETSTKLPGVALRNPTKELAGKTLWQILRNLQGKSWKKLLKKLHDELLQQIREISGVNRRGSLDLWVEFRNKLFEIQEEILEEIPRRTSGEISEK